MKIRLQSAGIAVALVLANLATSGTAAPSTNAPPRWERSIDSRTIDQWLSVRGAIVYGVQGRHVVAIDLHTGRLRWRSRVAVESRPAVGGQTIYAPIEHGIVALDSGTGHERTRITTAAPPTLLTAGSTALAVVTEREGSHRIVGFRDSLVPRWERRLSQSWDRPEDVGGGIVLLHADDTVLAIDARTGAVLAATGGVDDLVGRDGPKLWFSVAYGGLKSLDLQTNRTQVIHDNIVRGSVRVEGKTAVAVIDGRLKGISLPDGAVTPLHVDGRWVGGPAANTIFISRQDGIYAMRLGRTWSTRIVTNTSESHFLTATGTRALFATNDGSIVAVDLAGLTTRATVPTACRFVEGARLVDDSALVHCDDARMRSHLYAFDLHAGRR